MTKYCVMVTDSRDIAYHLEKALYLSRKGRGGPVWLDIPLDVQGSQIDPDTLRHFQPEIEDPWETPQVKADVVTEILERIYKAKAPSDSCRNGNPSWRRRGSLLKVLGSNCRFRS
jgi:acetolactate synthase-1/2/3 large subunit